MRKWDALVEKLTSYDEARGLKKSTLNTKSSELYRWGTWLKKQRPKVRIEDIDIDLIHKYIKARTLFKSKAFTCSIIGIMRAMGDLLVEEGIWTQNPLRWISGPKLFSHRRIPKNYHRSDLKKIFEESFNSTYPYFRKLYPAIISIFYTTGLRKSELLSLDLKDWNRTESTLKVYGSKTGQDRLVPVSEVAWKCIEDYLKARNTLLLKLNKTSDALFINRKGSRVNGTQILVQFKRIAKRAGVDKATIHMFRHSCATSLIEEGVPLENVKQVLGHACVQTTYRYSHIASPERVRAIRKHPINDILNSLKEKEYELR